MSATTHQNGRAATETQALALPNNLEAERALLGGLILDNRRIDEVVRRIPSEAIDDARIAEADRWKRAKGRPFNEALFYSSAHQMIFAAILRLRDQGLGIDLTTLSEELLLRGQLELVGGAPFIAGLEDDIFNLAQLPQYADIVVEKWNLRRLARASVAAAATDENVRRAAVEECGAAIGYLSFGKSGRLPERRTLGELPSISEADSGELLKHRFLCAGSVNTLIAPSGIGKSTFIQGAAILWALGGDYLGLQPARPLKTVIVQAENDWNDIAEMSAGVMRGMDLAPEEIEEAQKSVIIYTESSRRGAALAAVLEEIAATDKPDILAIDPVFAFLSGEVNSAGDVGALLRGMLIPLAQRHNLGVLAIHHSNKPTTGREKPDWGGSDFSYLGAGSAEFSNASRSVLAIRSLGSSSVFELRAAKRGGRLRWVDDDGQSSVSKYIAHDGRPGVLAWRYATPAEILDVETDSKAQKGRGRTPKTSPQLVRLAVVSAGKAIGWTEAVALIMEAANCGKRSAGAALTEAVAAGFVTRAAGLYLANSRGYAENAE